MEFRVRGYQVYYAFEAILLTCYQWYERRQTVKKLMMIYKQQQMFEGSHWNRLDEAISVWTYKQCFFTFQWKCHDDILLNWRLSYLGSEW